MADIVYFASTIDPTTGEVTLVRAVEPCPESVSRLIVYDPTNADPTLAQYHEAEEGDDET